MTAIPRKTQKIFGSALVPGGNIAVWGSLKDGAPAYSADPDVLQSAEWPNGFNGEVIGNRSPALEDLNGLMLVITQQLAYLFQSGNPEWDTATTYWRSQLARLVGLPFVAGSLTNNNSGHDPATDSNNWTTSPLSVPVRASTAGTQNIPVDGGVHLINFAAENLDVWSSFDPGTGIFTAPAQGAYFVSSEVQCDANGNPAGTTEMALSVLDVGSSAILATQGVSVPNPPGLRWYPSLAQIVLLNAGQQIEIVLEANSSPSNVGALTVSNGQLSIFKLP